MTLSINFDMDSHGGETVKVFFNYHLFRVGTKQRAHPAGMTTFCGSGFSRDYDLTLKANRG